MEFIPPKWIICGDDERGMLGIYLIIVINEIRKDHPILAFNPTV
jgi:hypothetical protein